MLRISFSNLSFFCAHCDLSSPPLVWCRMHFIFLGLLSFLFQFVLSFQKFKTATTLTISHRFSHLSSHHFEPTLFDNQRGTVECSFIHSLIHSHFIQSHLLSFMLFIPCELTAINYVILYSQTNITAHILSAHYFPHSLVLFSACFAPCIHLYAHSHQFLISHSIIFMVVS